MSIATAPPAPPTVRPPASSDPDVSDGATGVPLGRHLWTLALLLTGALQLAVAWSGWLPPLVLAVAVLVAYGVTSGAYRIGVPGWLASGSVLTLTSLAAELVTAPAGAPFGTAVRDAFPRLLTAPRPAPPDPDLLVPGVLLVVVLAVWAAVRQRRPGGAPLAVVAAATILYVAAALLTAGRSDPYGAVAVVLVVVAVLGWTAGSGARGGSGRLLPVLAVVAGIALVATTLPRGTAFEPRAHVSPPQLVLDEPSPLPRLAGWAQEADVELLTLATERPLPLRLVALTEFDGVTWRHPIAYRPFGAVAVPDLPPGRRFATVDAEVAITTLTGPWVPSPGRPTATTLESAHVDDASGTVASPDRLSPDLTYRIVGEVDDARAADLRDARVSTGPAVDELVALPPVPTDLAELSRTVIRGASTPFEQALLIEAAVRDGRRFDSSAPAGSSYARLRTFLLGDEDTPGAQAGTSEQFATAFAVLARANGLPTRVVVGFQPDTQVAPGRWVVRGRDALAWPEVHFEDWGWVRFAPSPDTPDVGLDEDTRDEVLEGLDERDEIETPDDDEPRPEPSPTDDAPGDDVDAGPRTTPAIVGVPALALLGAIVLAPPTVVALRWRRRHRHRRGGASGAWAEVLDLAALHRVDLAPSSPAPAVAADLAARWPVDGAVGGDHPAIRIARDADHAAFGPPGGHAPAGDRWPDVVVLRRRARRSASRWRRLTAPFDPRPLRRR